MQEYGWLNWNDFGTMAWLVVPKANQRKVRLLTCAIVRRLAERISDPRSAVALAAAEDYADFRIRREDLRVVAAAAEAVYQEFGGTFIHDREAAFAEWGPEWHYEGDPSDSMARMLRRRGQMSPAAQVAGAVAAVARSRAIDKFDVCGLSGSVAQILNPEQAPRDAEAPHCGLIRDIFGNPFRPVAFDPSWCNDAVIDLARGMYESRDFARMPALADALEAAGCADTDVLAHCRGPGPHVRGCWVLDLVLGMS